MWKDPPVEWANFENEMAMAANSPGLLIGDDKDHGKAWKGEESDVVLQLLSQVVADPTWQRRADLSPQDVLVYMVGRAMWGLPVWLTSSPLAMGDAAYPYVFPQVKSKCYADSGEKVCSKPGHSCWRRTINASRTPYKKAWKLCARGMRWLLRSTTVADHEVF